MELSHLHIASRLKLKEGVLPTVAIDLPAPSGKRMKGRDASAEASKKIVLSVFFLTCPLKVLLVPICFHQIVHGTIFILLTPQIVHRLFDASTSVTYTIHETVDEENLKHANGTPSLNPSGEQCVRSTNAPTMIGSQPLSRQSPGGPSVSSCVPSAPNQQFHRGNQLHNKKVQTTIKPKVRTVGIQVAIGENKKLLASRETQTDWTFQPPFPVPDYSRSVKTEVMDAV
uniref:uncharacterized protein isoform X1 n=2 Tax=Pristiophorus japonicus TaxID=55135 RepID=UPI00398F6570